jgi:ATP-dependent RNA helicase RhlE
MMSFTALGLDDACVHAVQSMGYVDPTPIQEKAIPLVLSGKDVVASSQTGTGKTAAFALPILSRLGTPGRLRALILEPTRELALQVEEAFRDYSRFGFLRTGIVYGGVGYGPQRDMLKRGADVLVATPGRLLDLVEQGDIKLDSVEHLVLDEADRMLDMGFMPDVRKIIGLCSTPSRQTLLFSATMPPEIEALAKWALRNPEPVEVGARQSPAETVAHAIYPVASSQKFELLCELLDRTHYESVLVFTRTKVEADRIAGWLKTHGHSVAVMHSDRSQRERQEALQGFREGTYEVMVATDIASRGIDIAGVTHVINYSVPEHPEDYVHRIGRTGRAQVDGDAFTLVTAEETESLAAIERFIGRPIERRKLDAFAYVYSTVLAEDAKGVGARKVRGGRARTGYSFGIRGKR